MKVLSAFVLLAVAACVPPETAAQAPTAGPIQMRTVNKGALSGVVQRINFYSEVHADCSSMGYPTVRIVSPPPNGRVLIEQSKDYPAYPQSNQRYTCNLNSVPGTAVSYLSNPGYVGPDSTIVEIVFPDGALWQTHSNILVR